MTIDKIYPNNIIIKYDYIQINNMYVASIIISELPKEISMLELNNLIPSDMENTVTIYIKKEDSLNKVKQLTKIIMETNSEIKSINSNQQDIDILKNINKEALELRKKLQVDNEEIYNINIYISLKDISLTNLKIEVNKIISNLYSIGVIAKVANFRHDNVYLSTLPFNNFQNNILNNQTAINITTSQLSYLMPYVSSNIYNQKGILYGFMGNSICIYDIFSKNNMNHNMCILGSSGAGKSYFLKTILLRNYCMNIMQIVLDIEGEYVNIANDINTVVLDDTNFNILYMPEIFILENKEDFLDKKIGRVYKLLDNIVGGKLSKYEKICKNTIHDLYKEFGITKNIDSLYTYYDKNSLSVNKEYIKYSKFPSYVDLIGKLQNEKSLPLTVIKKLKEDTLYKLYSKQESEKLDTRSNMIIVLDLNRLNKKNINLYIEYIKEYYGQKLLIYIDELWKVITKYKEYNIQENIADMYKSIRKKKAGIVTISQDIHDILGYNDGEFGKSILNNSFTKLFFKMQYMDVSSLNDIGIFTNEDVINIRRLSRGNAFMNIGETKFEINIKASEFENKIIQGVEASEKDFNSFR